MFPGWKPTGALALARNNDRLTLLKRWQNIARYTVYIFYIYTLDIVAMCLLIIHRTCQIETEIISPQEAGNLCPLIRVDDLLVRKYMICHGRYIWWWYLVLMRLCHNVCLFNPKGALWIPGDGVASSTDVRQSLAKGASLQGMHGVFNNTSLLHVQ